MADPAAAVAYVLARDGSGRREILVVRRSADDEDLPGVWGLPAATLQPGETHADAARRSARDKLGIEIAVTRELAAGSMERGGRRLEMTLLEAVLTGGVPTVPQPHARAAQYAEARWAAPAILEEARGRGSLCCRLFLDSRRPGPVTQT